jgi:SAM-dependent methyltransferase
MGHLMTMPLRREEAQAWVDRWDAMQAGYIPSREARFDTMFQILEAQVGRRFRALDLGCGPGSLSHRLLRRFPRARSVGVDLDPLLMALGKATTRDVAGRLSWVEADLRDPEWVRALPEGRFDAVVSSTALHWLTPRELSRLYGEVFRLLVPGGILLNADKAPFPPSERSLARISSEALHRAQAEQRARTGAPDWQTFWEGLRFVPALRELLAERSRRFPRADHHRKEPTVQEHSRALRAAGFREVGVLWRELENVILVAIRPGGRPRGGEG